MISLAFVGLGAGLSPFFFSYYASAVWVPIGLGLVLASVLAVVARPKRPSGPAALTLGGLLGLGVWSLASTAWAESVENAVVSGNRWLLYGALLVLVLVLVRGERRSSVLLGATALGIVAVAVSVLARLLGSDPASLFLAGRLNSPLGYINGEGCLFVMGFWLCMAVAESRRGVVAGSGAGLATLMACLALLAQSRGTALALVGSLIVVVALAPGRTRRVYGMLVVAAGVGAVGPHLLQIYDHGEVGAIPVAVAHAGGRAALLSAVGTGIVWGLLTAGWQRVRARTGLAVRARTVGSWLLLVPVVAALALAAAYSQRIERDVSRQWHAFIHLSEAGDGGAAAAATAGQTRLLSGAGNRYDYWRIAWADWLAHPVLGVGAGNYPVSYYKLRATTEDIEQPHSIELQALSELGAGGGVLLAAFIAGVGWGAVRMGRYALRSPLSQALMVGGLGMFAAWLIQASVDWMQLLPGLTAIALAGAAVLVAPGRRSDPGEGSVALSRLNRTLTSRTALALAASAVIATLIVAGASLSRQGLAEIYLVRAQNELGAHPVAALSDANRSLDFDPDNVETYYVKSAAFAHFGEAAAADAALTQALAREPDNFVTWALLGDIAVRRGKLTEARRDYLRAHLLNPRDPTLYELASDPRSALR